MSRQRQLPATLAGALALVLSVGATVPALASTQSEDRGKSANTRADDDADSRAKRPNNDNGSKGSSSSNGSDSSSSANSNRPSGDDGNQAGRKGRGGADKITICHVPPGNPDNAHTITVSSNAWAAHQAHGDHTGACEGDDADGVGADSDANDRANDNDKISICHIPPGNPANAHTIEISVNAWAAHEAHGDHTGACTPDDPSDDDNDKISICHIPPGNPANAHTIEISVNAWAAHEAHGDSTNVCPGEDGDNVDGDTVDGDALGDAGVSGGDDGDGVSVLSGTLSGESVNAAGGPAAAALPKLAVTGGPVTAMDALVWSGLALMLVGLVLAAVSARPARTRQN